MTVDPAYTRIFIDVFFGLIFIGIIYSALLKGGLSELFKLAGLVSGIFLAFRYYALLGEKNIEFLFLNKNNYDFISFFLIFTVTSIAFALIRAIVNLLVKRQPAPSERKVMFFFGAARAFLTISTLLFLLNLSGLNPKFYRQSISYKITKPAAPALYIAILGLYRRLDDSVKVNPGIKAYLESGGQDNDRANNGD